MNMALHKKKLFVSFKKDNNSFIVKKYDLSHDNLEEHEMTTLELSRGRIRMDQDSNLLRKDSSLLRDQRDENVGSLYPIDEETLHLFDPDSKRLWFIDFK